MNNSLRIITVVAICCGANSLSWGQRFDAVEGRQFPLNQATPPGEASRWAQAAGKIKPGTFQPIRIHLAEAGEVTFFNGSVDQPIVRPAPAQVDVVVGMVYRAKISGLESLPKQEFYPSIELIDQLHPPVGKEQLYPVEIEIGSDELEWVAHGRMITKVVYVEQANRIPRQFDAGDSRVITLSPTQNALGEADALGRPIAIIRIGGRTPDYSALDQRFFGHLGPVRVHEPVVSSRTSVTPGDSVGRVRLGSATPTVTISATR